MRGSVDEIAAEVRAFAALGVTHLALGFATTDPTELDGPGGAVRARGHTAGVTGRRLSLDAGDSPEPGRHEVTSWATRLPSDPQAEEAEGSDHLIDDRRRPDRDRHQRYQAGAIAPRRSVSRTFSR